MKAEFARHGELLDLVPRYTQALFETYVRQVVACGSLIGLEGNVDNSDNPFFR